MNIKTLKKYLNQKTREELIYEIIELSTKFSVVKDYCQEKSGASIKGKTLEKYKTLITHEFFPTRGYGRARLSIARKAVTDFKKTSQSTVELIDLMLHYVETGVRFTEEYGDINEPFYDSMENMYDKVLRLITEAGVKQEFRQRCHEIVVDTQDMGWGFHDILGNMYHDVFGNE